MRTTGRETGEERGTDATATIDRRSFVGAIGVAVAGGLAGCSSGSGSSGPPIEQPESHAQDMTIGVVEDGTARVQQEVHLEIDDPEFLMEFSTHAADGGFPVFDGRFIKADGSMYMQFGSFICQEYGQSESEVQAMAATPERFQGEGGLEQTGAETIDGAEVEVYEADVDDLPLDQLTFQPQGEMGGGDFGGQMPGGGAGGRDAGLPRSRQRRGGDAHALDRCRGSLPLPGRTDSHLQLRRLHVLLRDGRGELRLRRELRHPGALELRRGRVRIGRW